MTEMRRRTQVAPRPRRWWLTAAWDVFGAGIRRRRSARRRAFVLVLPDHWSAAVRADLIRAVLRRAQPEISWIELDIPFAESDAWDAAERGAAVRLAELALRRRNKNPDVLAERADLYVTLPPWPRHRWTEHTYADFVLMAPLAYAAAAGGPSGLRIDLADGGDAVAMFLTEAEHRAWSASVDLAPA